MSEQADLSKPDLRTDAERFEETVKNIFRVPKSVVMERIAVEKAERKKKRAAKQK